MIRFPDLNRRTLVLALAGGAVLFLAGFGYGYGYEKPCGERGGTGERSMLAE
jgi:hypothetical protein